MNKEHKPIAGAAVPDHASLLDTQINRRSFFKKTAIAGATAIIPIGLMTAGPTLSEARGKARHDDKGDVAILKFLAAAELLETDLWQQYNELAMGNSDFSAALSVLDTDMVAYVRENTEDELSHATFINGYLESIGAEAVNLDKFRSLPSSMATGANQTGRLTNLMHLNVDTSWYTRYRSSGNPDFGDSFPQIIDIVNRPAIPLHDGYTKNQMQAIANTAAFHFAAIEQGGSSLYDAMSLGVSHKQVLRVVTSIGGTEVAHFVIWNDKAGNAPAVDSGDGLVFPNFGANTQFPANQVMPKPCKFIGSNLPMCSIIRPTSLPLAGAMAAVHGLTKSGLFKGQSDAFFRKLADLAEDADEAMRED